ncbi:MAG: TRAP transporter substrate-binding protein DctP [Pseudomonadales bacterium]|nr:TRAP transporter substrate-binding protein DctP [Pseudomonadales bacterium]NRA14780.1 TRAP transporter substrate-binding protein DctP [Oceanospirillaceae bacterium]
MYLLRFLLIFYFLFHFSTASFAAPIVWKIQSNKPQGSSMLQIEQQMMSQIKRESEGALIFKLRSDNGFVEPRAAYNAVRTGEIDAMLMTPSYWAGADPVFAIMGDLVAAWNSPAQYLRWLVEFQGIQYLNRAYHRVGLKLLGFTVSPAESLLSTKPIANIDDFKRLVMRAPPGMISDFFQLLGARPRNIAGGKVLMALQQGRIDMADFSDLAVNDQLGAYRWAKHTNYPGFHSMPLYDFVVREKSWKKLSQRQQHIVMHAVERWQSVAYKVSSKELEQAKIRVIGQGVTLHHWSKAELKRARQHAVKVWDRHANKSDAAKVLISDLKQWLIREGNID